MSKEERLQYRDEVIDRIIYALTDENEKARITDLGDIGNHIGWAVGSVTCKNGKDRNLWSFEKSDFELGFSHGYSLMNGTH
jgi:hypothetical protein